MKPGEWQVVVHARPQSGSIAELRIVCCVLCESGHMMPMLRIARAVAARPSVSKVTYLTNSLGCEK
eukprot:8939514-Heterocapsa_arctica.AAC.1